MSLDARFNGWVAHRVPQCQVLGFQCAAEWRQLLMPLGPPQPTTGDDQPGWIVAFESDGTPLFCFDGIAQTIESILAALTDRAAATQERDALRAVVRRIVKDIPDLMFTDDEGDIWIGVDALPLAEKDAARAALGETP